MFTGSVKLNRICQGLVEYNSEIFPADICSNRSEGTDGPPQIELNDGIDPYRP